MLDQDKIRESLDRRVFANNPLNEAKKAKMLETVKRRQANPPRHFRFKPGWSVAALLAAAAVFILLIAHAGSPSHSGQGFSSSASWAYPFVKYKGTTYVTTEEKVSKVGKQIGEVTRSSDRETADESGNFSNNYPKGTRYYAIPGVPVSQAIAVRKKDGTFIKAINSKIWRSQPESFSALLDRLGSYHGVEIQSTEPSKWLAKFPKAETVTEVRTNLGNVNVVVFPRENKDVQIQTVSQKANSYKYKINKRSITSKQPLFFYKEGNLIAATSSKNLNDIFQIENELQKQAIFGKIDWTPSPEFTYHDQQLVGVKGKLGISDWPIYAGKPNKYLWYFIDKNLPADPFKVVGIHKSDGAKTKVFLEYDSHKMVWGFNPALQGGMPTEMVLPDPGIWSLTAFIGGKYYGSIVVNVLPYKPVGGKPITKVVVDKVGSDMNDLKQVKTFTKTNQYALSVFSYVVNNAEDVKGVIDSLKSDYVIELHYDDGTVRKYKLWVGEKGEKSFLLDINGSRKKNEIPANTTKELRQLLLGK
ncbi:MAG TPA: DUF4871 domain-containing protein [Bacillales bacterium]|nr:DUF4871 domain-containing protein [Bacillales bacterium]